jgi:hypothetical protein
LALFKENALNAVSELREPEHGAVTPRENYSAATASVFFARRGLDLVAASSAALFFFRSK